MQVLYIKINANVAQSVEQLIRNQQVRGSNPLISSKDPSRRGRIFLLSGNKKRRRPLLRSALVVKEALFCLSDAKGG